jgi:WAS family protein 3
MPLIKRTVEPVCVSRTDAPKGLPNELEYFVNFTLGSLIRQLSSISHHAEDIFRELYAEASAISSRRQQLETRINNLKAKALQLDPTVEEGTKRFAYYQSNTMNLCVMVILC